MAEAYKCDGCDKFFEGEPSYTITRPYLTVADPVSGWTFHQIKCIAVWVNKQEK